MLSFRQKIFISYITVFFLFIALLFPFVNSTVNDIIRQTMIERTDEVIQSIQNAGDDAELVLRLKAAKHKIFFRVALYNDDHRILYDSAGKRRMGPDYTRRIISHPEVSEAYEEGIGFHTDYSAISDARMIYMAKTFLFHGKTYVLRVAIPEQYVYEFTRNFQVGFTILATAVLLLFTVMTWFVINHLTNPIQQIINAIRPYQEGMQRTIPKLTIKSSNPKDDFGRLAETLNSLSSRIQTHINTLTYERNEKEAILESLVEGVIAVNSDLVVTYANHSAVVFLGAAREELENKEFEKTGHIHLAQLLKHCQDEQHIMTDQLQIKDEQNRRLYLDIIAAPMKEQSGVVLVMQDKTSHYRLLEMRKEFIANASHELKTPITIIRGYAETLHDNPGVQGETYEMITSKIVNNCERMTNLIKDLLALADIEQLAESRLEKTDLKEIVSVCSQHLHDVHPEALVIIDAEEGNAFVTLVDPQLIGLAVTNLLENAAKYSTQAAEITVGLRHFGDKIQLFVADRGVGIPREDLDRIFQRFYSVDRMESKRKGGSGLGLSLVETIIEKHFGKIEVESELGKGSIFTITLPVRQVDAD